MFGMSGVTSSLSRPSSGGASGALPEKALRNAYDAFNRGDIESAVAFLCDDVDWPNTIEGGREHGRDEVRAYWTRLFRLLILRVEPLSLRADGRGRIVVDAELSFSDPATGRPLAHQRAQHVFQFRGALIARMDTREPQPLDPPAAEPPGGGRE